MTKELRAAIYLIVLMGSLYIMVEDFNDFYEMVNIFFMIAVIALAASDMAREE